jgi:hypothetical protein
LLATVTGPYAAGLSVASNGCSGMVLEPHEACSVSVRFAPAAGGDAAGHLALSSDDGVLDVPLIATAPSLSGLLSPELPYPEFVPTGAADGVGYPQRWRLMLINPFRADVSIARTMLSGADARRFEITSNRCAHSTLRAHGGCRLTVMFVPTHPGTTRAQLTLQGTGAPLTAQLRPVAFALPAVMRLTAAAGHGCAAAAGARALVQSVITQPATVPRNVPATPTRGGAGRHRFAAHQPPAPARRIRRPLAPEQRPVPAPSRGLCPDRMGRGRARRGPAASAGAGGQAVGSRPSVCARPAASTRRLARSLRRMLETCTPAVLGLMYRVAAISRLVCPRLRSSSTASSRGVRIGAISWPR